MTEVFETFVEEARYINLADEPTIYCDASQHIMLDRYVSNILPRDLRCSSRDSFRAD